MTDCVAEKIMAIADHTIVQPENLVTKTSENTCNQMYSGLSQLEYSKNNVVAMVMHKKQYSSGVM